MADHVYVDLLRAQLRAVHGSDFGLSDSHLAALIDDAAEVARDRYIAIPDAERQAVALFGPGSDQPRRRMWLADHPELQDYS